VKKTVTMKKDQILINFLRQFAPEAKVSPDLEKKIMAAIKTLNKKSTSIQKSRNTDSEMPL
jgi:hypothetical protein